MAIPVFFVDDEPRLRTLWEWIVADQEDMTLAGTLASADELIERVPTGESIVLLDLSMPGRDPLEAAAEIRDSRPDCRVIIYSGYSDPETVRRAVESGAWGLVDKLTPPPQILDAIRRVAGGEAVFPPGFLG